MSVCAPEVMLEATITQFEDETIGFQITGRGGPVADDSICKMLMAVVRQIQRNHGASPALTNPLFQETPS